MVLLISTCLPACLPVGRAGRALSASSVLILKHALTFCSRSSRVFVSICGSVDFVRTRRLVLISGSPTSRGSRTSKHFLRAFAISSLWLNPRLRFLLGWRGIGTIIQLLAFSLLVSLASSFLSA